MKIKTLDKIVIISLDKFPSPEVIQDIKREMNSGQAKNKNLIIDLLAVNIINIEEVLKFQELSTEHTKNKCSLVIVTNNVNHNEVPENLHITPTILEAKDLIEMEEIERDLGF